MLKIFSFLLTLGALVCALIGFVVGSSNGQEEQACDMFGTCSQGCLYNENGHVCYCDDGFELQPNGKDCRPTDDTWKVIYSDATRTYVGVFPNGHDPLHPPQQTLKSEGSPVGVTYDARNNVVYWTDFILDGGKGAVNQANLLDGSTAEVFSNTVKWPAGIAFDWTTGNLYYGDIGNLHIGICSTKTRACGLLVEEGVGKPAYIAVFPGNMYLYWLDKSEGGAITRAGLDGKIINKIILENSAEPTGLAVDQNNGGRVYWTTETSIGSCRGDGSDQRILKGNSEGLRFKIFFGVAVFGDRLFWADSSNGTTTISSAAKFDMSDETVHLKDGDIFILDLAVIYEGNQPSKYVGCDLSGCSHICTHTPFGSQYYTCFCPFGMRLSEDDKTCVDE